MIAIKTPRLVLRKFLEKDVPGLLEYFRNPRVACFPDEKVENPDKMLEEIRRRNESPEGTELAVCIRESDNVIGNVFSRKEMEDTYSVGWNLNKNYEGKGYAAEAAKAYLDFLFTKKNVVNFHSKCTIPGGFAELFSKAFLCRFFPGILPRPASRGWVESVCQLYVRF